MKSNTRYLAAAVAAALAAALAYPAEANVVNLKLDLTTNDYGKGGWAFASHYHKNEIPKFLGAYDTGTWDEAAGNWSVLPSAPLGTTFSGLFTVDTSLWSPGSLNYAGLVDFHMTIGNSTWTLADFSPEASGFQTGNLNQLKSFAMFFVNPDGNILSVNWHTGRPGIDTFVSSWVVLDETVIQGGCIIGSDYVFSGFCMGSARAEDIKISLAPQQPSDPGFPDGGEPGSVPEPASWATMIAGFGAVGASLRRRRVKQKDESPAFAG